MMPKFPCFSFFPTYFHDRIVVYVDSLNQFEILLYGNQSQCLSPAHCIFIQNWLL